MERRMKYMSWTQFDELRKSTKTVILPSGAFEVYGPHMPLGSDTLVSPCPSPPGAAGLSPS